MTTQVIQMFGPTLLTESAATLYTVAGAANALLARGRVRFTNTSGSAVNVTAYGIPTAGTAGTDNQFCPAISIAPNSNLDIDVPVLEFGGFIQAFASATNAIVAHALDGVLFS